MLLTPRYGSTPVLGLDGDPAHLAATNVRIRASMTQQIPETDAWMLRGPATAIDR